MQRKVISWNITRQADNQAAGLTRARMPVLLRLADNILRVFGWHIDRKITATNSSMSGEEKELREFMEIPLLYRRLNEDNHFEIYYELFKLVQQKPQAPAMPDGLLADTAKEVHYGNVIYPANALAAENRFIGYLSLQPAVTVQYDNDRSFELKDMTLYEMKDLGISKNGLYLFQFQQDAEGKTKMTANEIIWNNAQQHLEISQDYYPDFQLLSQPAQ